MGESSGDLQLKSADDRVQDIVKLESSEASNPSTRKYPVDPTKQSFQHVIDAVHAAIHVYDREGSDRALQWLKERGMDNNEEFKIGVIALLETVSPSTDMHETLRKIAMNGKTSDYLDIDLSKYVSANDSITQTELTREFWEDNE
jgi:hypothetical protein